jgi:hypothetical protein
MFPAVVQSVLVIAGAPNTAEVMPFWRAVLGYEPRSDTPDQDLVDPCSRGPSFWFEPMDEPRPDGRGAIHVAIWCPTSRPRRGSLRRWPPAARWCATSSRRPGGRWQTPRATRRVATPRGRD